MEINNKECSQYFKEKPESKSQRSIGNQELEYPC